MNHTFSILFYIRKDKRVRSERAPIYLRITVNGKRAEQSIKRSIDTERWDSDLGYVKGNKRDAREINLLIDNLRIKVRQIHNQLIEKSISATSNLIKNILNGVNEEQKSLIEIFNYHNQIVKDTIGIDYAEATYIRYLTTKKHIVEFMESTYKICDIKLTQLKFQIIRL